MLALPHPHPHRNPVMGVAVALALLAAVGYLLIQFHVLGVGDLQTEEQPAAIVYVAAACYFLGGLLILARRRWLWIFGAVMNALVLWAFFSFYQNRPAVMFSPGGLATKAAQLLLEAVLVYLIVADWQHGAPRTDRKEGL